MCEALPKVKKPLKLNRTHGSIYFVPFVPKLTQKSVGSVVWTGRVLSVNMCRTYSLNLSHVDFNTGKQTLPVRPPRRRLLWIRPPSVMLLCAESDLCGSVIFQSDTLIVTACGGTTDQNWTENKLKCILGLISAVWLPPPAVTPSI